jgi:ferredoxin
MQSRFFAFLAFVSISLQRENTEDRQIFELEFISSVQWREQWNFTEHVKGYNDRVAVDVECIGVSGCSPDSRDYFDPESGWQGTFVKDVILPPSDIHMLQAEGAVVSNESNGNARGPALACPVIFAYTPSLSGSGGDWTRLAGSCRSSLLPLPKIGEDTPSPAVAVFTALKQRTRC